MSGVMDGTAHSDGVYGSAAISFRYGQTESSKDSIWYVAGTVKSALAGPCSLNFA